MTTPGVADSKPLMRANLRAHDTKAKSLERKQAMRQLSMQINTPGTFALDYFVTGEIYTEERYLMRAGIKITLTQAKLSNALKRISGFP